MRTADKNTEGVVMGRRTLSGEDSDDQVGDDSPGVNHNVVAILVAKKEAKSILTEIQYAQCISLVKRLCEFGDRHAMADLDIRQFGDFWELRLKGGFLKKINLRIYFADLLSDRDEIVVLKTYKKEEDGATSPHVRITLEDRLEDYRTGALQKGVSVYRKKKD